MPALLFLAIVALLALDDRGRLFLLLIAVAQPEHLVFLMATRVCGKIWRLRVIAIGFGLWPPMLVLRAASNLFVLGALPLGSYVRWPEEPQADNNDNRPLWRDVPATNFSELTFQRLHPLSRVFICLGGPAATLLFAFALRGMGAFTSFQRGFEQFIGSLFRSREANMAMLRPFLARIEGGDVGYAMATLAAKHAAANLIPFSTAAGGMALLAILEWVLGRRIKQGVLAAIQIASLMILLAYACVIGRALWELLIHWNR